jgi:hypothetical protein
MTDVATGTRFALERVDDRSWNIRDTRASTRTGQPIGRVRVSDDDDVEVIWAPTVPLPVVFATAEDALESLENWARGRRGATKPIPIPHFPPPRP